MSRDRSEGEPRLSERLPGTWRLLSRIDVTAAGVPHRDPSLGTDPVALLIYDGAGNFAAQFMKRDRGAVTTAGPADAKTNTQDGDSLVIRLETSAWDGTPVTRTLTWERVG